MNRSRSSFVTTLVVVLALLAAGCSDDGKTGAAGDTSQDSAAAADSGGTAAAATDAPGPEPEKFEGGDFYAPPDPLPAGPHGTLIRYQPIDGVDVAGASAWRIMYLSEAVSGQPIAVTGTVLVPPGEAPATPRRILTLSHGTTGIADECAPSKSPGRGELALTGPFIEAGYVVAQTDYEGLGTPGRHPYLVGVSEGRGVLDAALAARQVPGSDAGTDLAIVGYSQGGHGALFANQLAKEWTPELKPAGVVAGAPATELDVIFSAAGGLPAARGFVMMTVAGFAAAYPQADPKLILTDQGENQLDKVDQGCVGDVIGAFASEPEPLIEPKPTSIQPWGSLTKENNPGQVVTDDPILIVHSAADRTVPVALSGILFNRMCGMGQVVERRIYNKGQSHVGAAPDAYADTFKWFTDRFNGVPATSTCPNTPPAG